MDRRDRNAVRLALLAVCLLSLAWGFHEMLLRRAPAVFQAPEEDLSYAWYVPLFSLYVVWRQRAALRQALGEPSWGGLLACLPFLAFGFFGVRGCQVRLEMLAFSGLLVTIPWAFFGRAVARLLLFPAAFLLFCLPMASYLDVVTVHLRLFACTCAHAILRGIGVDVLLSGTALTDAAGTFAVDVANPCSGLRSIFALMALTAGYAYFNQRTFWRKWALFALSVPLAVIGNVTRIMTICLVAKYADPTFATGFYHDYSGYLVFAVAILLMIACGEFLNRGGRS